MSKTKWKVQIPPPNAKRLTIGVLVVVKSSGWEAYPSDRYPLAPDATEAVFELPDCFEWSGTTSVIDEDQFGVYVEFTNQTGRRKITTRLIPEKVGE